MEYIGRHFQVWDYVVSLNKLLMRSPKRGAERNIDLRFFGVKYLRLGTAFDGLSVTQSRLWPLDDPAPMDFTDAIVFLLSTKGREDVVVASSLKVEENDLEIMTSSLQRP
jgi:hypothetical protein